MFAVVGPRGSMVCLDPDRLAAWRRLLQCAVPFAAGEPDVAGYESRGYRCVECRLVPVPDPPEAHP